MIPRTTLAAIACIFLAATTSPAAAAGDDLPYTTVTLDGFERAAIHKRAVALMRTTSVYDEEGNFVSSDTDAFLFDNLSLRQLTTDGGAKLAFSLKSSSRYIGWAQYLSTGVDIMAYDLKRDAVVNVSNTPISESPFFDLADDRFAWTVLDDTALEYDFVLSDGRKSTTINEAANDRYSFLSGDPQTSRGNAAFGASGTDPEDGSFDSELFFYDGHHLRQVTDDDAIGTAGAGYDDAQALVSGKQVVFVTTNPDLVEPFQLRIYDGAKKRIRTILSGGSTIASGEVLADRFCFPIDFSGDLLIWNGSIVGTGPVFLATNVRTGQTQSLDELTGGSVIAAATNDGYIAMFSQLSDGTTRVMVYRPKTNRLTTAFTHDPGFFHSGVLSVSGPNVAYNYFEANGDPKVAIHYRSDEYKKEVRH